MKINFIQVLNRILRTKKNCILLFYHVLIIITLYIIFLQTITFYIMYLFNFFLSKLTIFYGKNKEILTHYLMFNNSIFKT